MSQLLVCMMHIYLYLFQSIYLKLQFDQNNLHKLNSIVFDVCYMHKIYIYTGSPNDRSDTKESDNSGLDSLSTGVAITITNAATFILTLSVTAIITFIIAYFCVKRRFVNPKSQYLSPQEEVLCEQANSPNHIISKDDLELQPDPAYGTGHEVIKVTNAVYENCK